VPLEALPFRADFLEEAAALVAASYRAARETEPLLPERFEAPTAVLPLLKDLAGRGPGVAAVAGGQLAGFLLSRIVVPRVERMAWVPDCGHGLARPGDGATCREMYAAISRQWVVEGCLAQSVSIHVHDRDAAEAWFSLGFGLTWVDALRDLEPAAGADEGVEIRRAGRDDIDILLHLEAELVRHLTSAPTSLVYPEDPQTHARRSWAAGPVDTTWIAFRDGEAVGYLTAERPGGDAPVMARTGRSTASVGGAYVVEDARSSGVGAALLNRSLQWARSEGCERCAADWESANVPAHRFWLGKGFRPVVYTLLRRVEERDAG